MSLFHLMSVSASGMAAQRRRVEALTENLANAETTRTPEGGPYRRKDVLFETVGTTDPFAVEFASLLDAPPDPNAGMAGVRVADVVEDMREPEKRYQPNHPDADPQGYVAYPRLNPAEEMVDLMGASRGYQSNVAALSAIKDMIERTLDVMRG